MTMKLGYAVSSAIFFTIFIINDVAQVAAKRFHPFLYWAVIVATTTVGATIADFADRSLGIGYAGGASILFVLRMAALGAWYWSAGSVSVDTATSLQVEMSYSYSPKPWASRSAIGWPTQLGSATKEGRSYSPQA